MKKIFTLLTVFILSGCSITDIFSKDPEVLIDAAELARAYEEDKVSAGNDYDEKYIQVTGIINYISGDNDETIIQMFGGVVCSFTSNVDELKGLKPYNKVVFNGTVEGLDINGSTVIIKKCDYEKMINVPDVITTAEELSSLNTVEMGYKIIEVTGVAEYIESSWFTGWTLLTEDAVRPNLILYFEVGFDFSEIDMFDTVKVTGTFIRYTDYRTNSSYQVYAYDIEVVN